MVKRFLMVMGIAILSVGCATVDNPKANVDGKAWRQVQDNTKVITLGSNRLRISASTPFASSLNGLENDMLVRAAGEAAARGAPRFAIVHVQYEKEGVSRWIGTYEDLQRARHDADFMGSLDRRFSFKTMNTVVRLLGEDEEAARKAFDSKSTFDALLASRVEAKGIKPSRKLDVWPF